MGPAAGKLTINFHSVHLAEKSRVNFPSNPFKVGSTQVTALTAFTSPAADILRQTGTPPLDRKGKLTDLQASVNLILAGSIPRFRDRI